SCLLDACFQFNFDIHDRIAYFCSEIFRANQAAFALGCPALASASAALWLICSAPNQKFGLWVVNRLPLVRQTENSRLETAQVVTARRNSRETFAKFLDPDKLESGFFVN
ncbi:MAG TPA: hypothetical protein PKA83_07600, partial [Pirellulaceae bacterium]|nr:hypothetical protein [Pirellulaceae bacterium]